MCIFVHVPGITQWVWLEVRRWQKMTHAPCTSTSGHVLIDAVLQTQMNYSNRQRPCEIERNKYSIIGNLLHSQITFASQGSMRVVKSPTCPPIPSGTCWLPETLEWSKFVKGLVLAGFWRLVALKLGPIQHTIPRELLISQSSHPCGPWAPSPSKACHWQSSPTVIKQALHIITHGHHPAVL